MHGLLKDKVVVVAGYGYGLGAALAEQAALQGAQLVISARTEEKLEAAAKELRGHRVGVLCVPCDFDQDDAGEVLAARTIETYGQVDVLLNNAFRMPPMDPLTQVAPHKIQKSISTNVIAPLRLATAFTRVAAGLDITDTHNGLRAFTAAAARALRITQNRMAHASEILHAIRRLRLRFVEVPVTIDRLIDLDQQAIDKLRDDIVTKSTDEAGKTIAGLEGVESYSIEIEPDWWPGDRLPVLADRIKVVVK